MQGICHLTSNLGFKGLDRNPFITLIHYQPVSLILPFLVLKTKPTHAYTAMKKFLVISSQTDYINMLLLLKLLHQLKVFHGSQLIFKIEPLYFRA
ncbi:hypothetical protein SAMN05444008_12021 [Cnuella takakiae]|uniref:Uncharacterized protein n=1 Tax=Cnuella takakiae TaxID=1302690 RepID=A0A1M5HR20_9BACT|nr:hypothetical protein SAMN05444008_12021 [Cnuella takakiae]